ncbi:Usp32, partial [Symbiodinium microadriaticum]
EGRMGESSFEGLPGSGGGRCGRTGSSTASSSTGDLDCTDASTMTTASSPQFEDDQVHLSDCLATFTAAETLQQDMQCAHCRVLCGVSKRLTVQVPPNCLLIHLKRFHVYSPGATSLECNKVDTMVHFPTRDLDLSPFLSSDLLDVMSGNNGPQEKDCSSPLFGDGETPLKESSSDLGNTDCDSVESSRGGSATRSILTNRAGSKKSSTSRSDFARLPTEATSGRDSESSSSGKLSAMSSQLAGGCGHVAIADGTAPSLLYDLEGVVCHIGPSLTQ